MDNFDWDDVIHLGTKFFTVNDEFTKDGDKTCGFTTKFPFIHEPQDEKVFIDCPIVNCTCVFDSLSTLEAHQRARHTFICATCSANLPSHYLLDIHITERHDSYFAIRAERQPMFQCLLEGCIQIFTTHQLRKDHCIKEHFFPADYKFETKWRKLKSKNEATPEVTLGSEKSNWDHDIKMEEHANAQSQTSKSKLFGRKAQRGFSSGTYKPWHKSANSSNQIVKDIVMEDVGQAINEIETETCLKKYN